MRKVEVVYDGVYPCACMGGLVVKLDGDVAYTAPDFTFTSTGSVWFDDDGDEHVEDGELKWKDKESKRDFYKWARQQPEAREIIDKVKLELSLVNVCCGGCI